MAKLNPAIPTSRRGMVRHVLLPLDGSELAERAVDYAATQAAQFDAPLTLLRAVEGPARAAQLIAATPAIPEASPVLTPSTVAQLTEAGRAAEAEARGYLARQAQQVQARGIAVETLVSDAAAVEAILQESERKPDTIVVMATHGRGGLGRLVFGSTAEDVLRRARVPILLVRATDTSDGRGSRV